MEENQISDNITLNAGAGGATLAADDISSVWYQRVKLTDGTADSTTPINVGNGVSANALRVTLSSDGTGVVKIWDGTDTALVSAAGNLQTEIAVALPAGTNAIGKLAANSGVDIGDVDVTSIAAGTNLIGKVSIDQVTANANEVVIKSGTVTNVSQLGGAAVPIGAGTEAAALRVTLATDSTGVVSVDDNGGNLSIDWAGTAPPIGAGLEATALRVTLATDSTGVVSIDDNGASLTVDNAALSVTGGGTEAGALRVTLASDSTGVVSVDDNGGNISIDWAGTVPPIGAGTEAAALRVTLATDSTGVVSIDDNGASLTVDNADITAAATSLAVMDDWDNGASDGASVSGDVAHDSADAGEPVKIGMKAYAAAPTAVAANDRVNAIADLEGRQIVRAGNQDLTAWAVNHVPAANTVATITQASAGGALKNVCTSITATLVATGTAPSAAQVFVYLRDGASGAGTIKWAAALSIPAVAGATSGIVIPNLWIVGTAATAMCLEFSGAGGANTQEVVSMTGAIIT